MRVFSIAMALFASLVTGLYAHATETVTNDQSADAKPQLKAKRTLSTPKRDVGNKPPALMNHARVETPSQSTLGDIGTAVRPAPAANEAPKEPAVSAVLVILETTRPQSGAATVAERKALYEFYNSADARLIWMSRSNGPNERARYLFKEFKSADDWGLDATQFKIKKATSNLFDKSSPADALPVEDVAQAEVDLSLTALKYARHARGGRIPEPSKQLSSYLDRKPPLLESSTVMDGLRNSSQTPDAYLRSLHPKHAQFEKLRKALLAMRSGEKAEPKPEDIKLPRIGPILRNGKSHVDVALLRKRLEVPASSSTTPSNDSDTADISPDEVFDDELEAAVKKFQKDNDLYTDGLVGKGTRRALNGAATDALTEDVLIANMEAWRWMPDDLGDTYVTVNIPEYMMRVVKNGKIAHEERAILGKTNNQTPVFSDQMETVVFHPFWAVPNSIKVKELLPSLARGGNSFRRQGLRIQKNGRDVNPDYIDWSYADIRKYHVYQPPGRSNVLGVVKFLFPNKHQVYLHDTPTKHLFKKNVRTYSHGCMRVRNPVQLAKVVLEHDKNWDNDHIDDLIKNGPKNNEVKLDAKLPVHVTYFTAVVDDDGTVRRLKDVYGHEKRIKLALAGKFHLIARGRDHLAPVKYKRPQYAGPQSVNDILQAIFSGF